MIHPATPLNDGGQIVGQTAGQTAGETTDEVTGGGTDAAASEATGVAPRPPEALAPPTGEPDDERRRAYEPL